MPVTVRGAYAGKVSPAGWTTITWPAGTAEGDLAWVHCGGSMSPLGPDSFGWIPVGHKAWWKILSASDLSASLTVSATHVKLVTFGEGQGRVGHLDGEEIAVLDVRRILSDSAAGKDALARLKKLTEDKEAQGRGMQQELVDLENKMKAGRLSLAEDALAKLQKDGHAYIKP